MIFCLFFINGFFKFIILLFFFWQLFTIDVDKGPEFFIKNESYFYKSFNKTLHETRYSRDRKRKKENIQWQNILEQTASEVKQM